MASLQDKRADALRYVNNRISELENQLKELDEMRADLTRAIENGVRNVTATAVEDTNGPKFPDVSVQLTGEDGNGFFIASRVRKALERAGHKTEGEECFNEMLSGDYDHLLQTAMRWVNVS